MCLVVEIRDSWGQGPGARAREKTRGRGARLTKLVDGGEPSKQKSKRKEKKRVGETVHGRSVVTT